VKLHWKFLRLAAFPALLLLAGGCGGINASQSVSPASFFLPGLLKADPPSAPSTPAGLQPEPVQQVAQVR
jgi:hypothetical protein